MVAPVGVDRSSRGRKSATGGACDARGVRARGRTRARRTGRLTTGVTATRAAVVAYQRVAVVGKSKSTWVARTREPDDLMLHLVECVGVTVVNVRSSLYAFWWQEASER